MLGGLIDLTLEFEMRIPLLPPLLIVKGSRPDGCDHILGRAQRDPGCSQRPAGAQRRRHAASIERHAGRHHVES